MTEEKPPTSDKPAEPPADQPVVNEEQIKELEVASMRLEAANKKFEANQQLAKARSTSKALAGTAEAIGTPQKEETPKEYKDRVLKEGYKQP